MSEIIDLKRRNFLKGSAAAAVGAGVATTSAFALESYGDAKEAKKEKEEDIKNATYTPSICGMCVNMCGVIARNVDGKVTKIEPNPLYTKSRNFMCARGQAGIASENDPDRITTPLIRVGEKGSGKFRKATWEEALDFIAKKMVKILEEEKDNRSTFVFGAGASTGNMGDPVFANLINGVGSANFIDHFSTCFAPSFMANKMIFGTWGLGDFAKTKYLLNLGANRAEGIVTPDTLDMFRRTHGRGIEKIVYIDPRYTNTASHSDEFIPIKPGTDLALMLAMIWETINQGYHKTPYKADYIAKYVDGIEELEEYFTTGVGKNFTPEWAEKITDIPADTIKRLTKEFADAAEKYKGAANCYRSRKSTWYYQDFDFRRAQAIFNSIHGCVNRPGGVSMGNKIKKLESYEYEDFPIYDNAKPRIDIAKVNHTPGEYPLANPTKGTWQVLRDTILDVNTRWKKGEKLADWEYPVRGMFIYKQNPMQSVPDYWKTAEALKSVDLVVNIDVIVNDTAFYSDVILPDTTYLERESLVKQFGINEPIIAWRRAAQKPRGDAKHIYYISSEIAKRIEKPFADITFRYTWDADELGAELPKGFKLDKYLTDDFEIDEDKLKADIKDEALVKAILEHASEDDLDIATYKISAAFEKTISEFNEEVMTEAFGKEAMEIAKEYGGYWPGIEDAIKDGVVDGHYKKVNLEKLREAINKADDKVKQELEEILGKDYTDTGNANYAIYKLYSKLPEDWYIHKINKKFIKLALHNIDGKPFKNPITGKTEKLGKFPMWRDELYREPDTKKGQLRVVLGRHAYFTQSAGVNNYLLLDLMNYNYVWINDEFAKEHGLKFKDDVILTNADGRDIKAKVFPTKRIRKDTAYIATGFGSKSTLLTLGENNGISQAEVCDNSIDPIIGSASMNETIITIRKV
jgi:thiosulfate reductase/polysulfide reductase chain A